MLRRYKNSHIWLPSYCKQRIHKFFDFSPKFKPIHIFFCLADAFEVDQCAGIKAQEDCIKDWLTRYPQIAAKHKDADGYHPKHTFFYPHDSYREEHLELLSELCRQGFAEVELFLRHSHDTQVILVEKLEKAKADFRRYGLLGQHRTSGATMFGLIHDKGALNNAGKQGAWCGINNESRILKDSGCYSDFSFPSVPYATQPSKVNSIYYDRGSCDKAKSHNCGENVEVLASIDEQLMIIEGPLALNWDKKVLKFIPTVDTGTISNCNLPTVDRVDLWIDHGVIVDGKPDWIFVKIKTFGASEENRSVLLDEPLDVIFMYLEEKFNNGNDFVLHYVSAREMFNLIKAAEQGKGQHMNIYRDYLVI